MASIIRRARKSDAADRTTDPRLYRVSEHFVLSDFLGNYSTYTKGFSNPFIFDGSAEHKLANLDALCRHGLEPLLTEYGPMTVSYGYISPELSRQIITYQDPDKPSHHRFDLGAAADICMHRWVAGEFETGQDLYFPNSVVGSPISLAHTIDYLDIPYSRLITYSESPYLCLAVSAEEVNNRRPRRAFYENRFTGVPKAKPRYTQMPTSQARDRALQELQEKGLEHGWIGSGYPTYHGGGICQYQHRRVSRFTMVSDWLFSLKSISEGYKNVPSLNNGAVQDAFAAAGIAYDWTISMMGIPRMSIVSAYVSHTSPAFNPANDWREDNIQFTVVPPASRTPQEVVAFINHQKKEWIRATNFNDYLVITLSVDGVLTDDSLVEQEYA